MILIKNLRFAIAGWVGGIVTALGLGLLWIRIFPAIVEPGHYLTPGPGLPFIYGVTLLIITPIAIIGGLVGARLPQEGGRTEQTIVAALIGGILVIPFGCAGLWIFTGN